MRVEIFDHMEECTEAEVQRMLPLVSAQRREQALRYRHVFGQYCCLKSWMMLRETVDNGQWTKDNGQRTKDKGQWTMDNGQWTKDNGQWTLDHFEYNEHGKPFIEGGLHFSISHCKEGIAVVVDDEPVGIDIEHIRPASDDLIERVMNEEEQRLIAEASAPDRAFTKLWTQKEAIVKAQGVGIQSFEQLQTILDNGQWTLDTFEKENYMYSIAQIAK